MVRFLRVYVSDDRRNERRTHAKRSIALLPRQFASLFVRPSRGIRFDREHRLGERQNRRNLDEEVNMIVRPAHGMNQDPVILANARDVGPQSRLEFF